MRLLRRHYSLTQQQIADKMGVSRGNYQYAETRCPKDIFDKIAEFWITYGITPNELLIDGLEEIFERESKQIENLSCKIEKPQFELSHLQNELHDMKLK